MDEKTAELYRAKNKAEGREPLTLLWSHEDILNPPEAETWAERFRFPLDEVQDAITRISRFKDRIDFDGLTEYVIEEAVVERTKDLEGQGDYNARNELWKELMDKFGLPNLKSVRSYLRLMEHGDVNEPLVPRPKAKEEEPGKKGMKI